MWILDIFKIKQFKQTIADLTAKTTDMEKLLTPEMQDAERLSAHIRELQLTIDEKNSSIADAEKRLQKIESESDKLKKEIDERKEQIISLDDEILVQSFGLYKPKYDFARAEEYKMKLDEIRAEQTRMIKDKTASTGATNWNVNGSASQGKKMVADMQKLLLRAFNSECDEIVSRVRYNNYEASLKRIDSSCDAISKLGKIMSVSISAKYRQLKIEELRLALEYQIKKHDENERLKELRAQQREEAKLQREIEEQRRKIEKEEKHYLKALADIDRQIAADPTDEALLAKRVELVENLKGVQEDLRSLEWREAHQKAGYVYIISNIGAFGENVYKIGMTRRTTPKERVDELGDASVPFNFDIHAMIFTEDAPKLEAALHKAFEDRKLNMVNQRREFFRVTLDEIKEVVWANFDKTVEFYDVPEAEQYRISEKMRAGLDGQYQ